MNAWWLVPAAVVWALMVLAIVSVFQGGTRGPHPRPEAPSIGEDPTDADDLADLDEWAEQQHAAWEAAKEPPATGI